MVSFLKALVYGAGGVVVVGMAALVALQERLVYVPVLPGLARAYPITPARLRLDYEDVFFRSSDGVRLHAWFVKQSPWKPGNIKAEWAICSNVHLSECKVGLGEFPSKYRVMLDLEDPPRSADEIMMQKLHCNVFMLSYRGYGESDGYPSQHGIIMDAQAALDHLIQRTDIDTSRIVVFGRSLGGAVGAMLARNNPDKVSAIILENTFTSILDMAAIMFPFLKWFIGSNGPKGPKILNYFVRSPWSTIDIIDKIEQPILFLSGLRDELVPPSHMQMLRSKAIENNRDCRFVDFPNGMHMDTWYSGGDRYWRAIQLFLDQYVPEIKECNISCKVGEDKGKLLR
ncbi:hypothetical protein ZIOFF_062144 [Zingiber officinale]|uniref:Peptidase S9 prolyl oligopeptidase catalytic domain-containing protein n=1 Tax=Zingiber officinale TaxID=94328 RepID=A0A8J5F003_ZINOF|nr:hypothetical protein ZIOFF_062144 [Zingiber officinale]